MGWCGPSSGQVAVGEGEEGLRNGDWKWKIDQEALQHRSTEVRRKRVHSYVTHFHTNPDPIITHTPPQKDSPAVDTVVRSVEEISCQLAELAEQVEASLTAQEKEEVEEQRAAQADQENVQVKTTDRLTCGGSR